MTDIESGSFTANQIENPLKSHALKGAGQFYSKPIDSQ